MTLTLAAVLGGFAMLVAAIAGLLVQRRALRESVEQFRLRSDQAPVLIWTARPDTTLDYINGFCEQLTGRPLEVLRENGWLDFVHPEDLDKCFGKYMPAFEARTPAPRQECSRT
jgi:PAS domain-containing protein